MFKNNLSAASILFYSLTLGFSLSIFKVTLIARFSQAMTINELFKLNELKDGYINTIKQRKYQNEEQR